AKMAAEHLSPYSAVKSVLGEISGAVIAITFLMTAVFVPVAFMGGPVGVFYRQFSITMASAIVLSGLVALTLTPVLTAMILKGHGPEPQKKNPLSRLLHSFNEWFERMTNRYIFLLKKIAHRKLLTFGLIGAFCVGIFLVIAIVPPGFIPN